MNETKTNAEMIANCLSFLLTLLKKVRVHTPYYHRTVQALNLNRGVEVTVFIPYLFKTLCPLAMQRGGSRSIVIDKKLCQRISEVPITYMQSFATLISILNLD